MKNKSLKKKKWYQSGFTLLFATLVASLLLSLSISILDITLQNFILSSTGRESQFAFYAADSGLDCAEYWDVQYPGTSGNTSAFTFAPNDTVEQQPQGTRAIECDGQMFTVSGSPMSATTTITQSSLGAAPNPTDATTTTTFQVDMTQSGVTNECYVVSVSKGAHIVYQSDGITPDLTQSSFHTSIQSRGYNTCDPTNLRRLERGIQIDY